MEVLKDGKLSLATILRGEALSQFDQAFQAVADNICDPNTEATQVRTIALVLKVKPTPSREVAAVSVAVTPKLAPSKPATTTFVIGLSKDGAVLHELAGKQQPLFDHEGETKAPPTPPSLATQRAQREDEKDDA